MNKILVVGSVAYDSIQTPTEKNDHLLGGSANYFSLSASLLSSVQVVGVVGTDYADKDFQLLRDRGVDLKGLQTMEGETFKWKGKYENAMNEAVTLDTRLNVFESFNPVIPDEYKTSEFLFLANIDPDLQLKVLEQVEAPKLVLSLIHISEPTRPY